MSLQQLAARVAGSRLSANSDLALTAYEKNPRPRSFFLPTPGTQRRVYARIMIRIAVGAVDKELCA